MASSKRRRNAKHYERKGRAGARLVRPGGPAEVPASNGPSEFDQITVFITEAELGLPDRTLSQVRILADGLPFETAMVDVARLQARIEPVLRDPVGHWRVAQEFYADRPELLAGYQRVLSAQPHRVIFSPQPLTVLMRILIDVAADEPLRAFTATEFRRLQDAVLGAHSALETALGGIPPSVEDALAYEVQAATLFRRPPALEEMARHRELLRLATNDRRLNASPNRVPVDRWLAAGGLTAPEQWAIGFGLALLTDTFHPPIRPHALVEHVDDVLRQLGLDSPWRELSPIAATRAELQQSLAALSGGDETLAWELRPFKATPFLRLGNGDLVLLAPPWLLSWLGEGFHYRALSHAQRAEGAAVSAKYTRFVGEVVERYALDLAEAANMLPARVIGEQAYGVGGGQRTSDVALGLGRDLVLFEIHARRVGAIAAVTGAATDATLEVSRLLVVKIEQIGQCISALLSGRATLPGVNLANIDRIWPVVVSVGHVFQTRNLWAYMRGKLDPTKTASLAERRVQPLQVMDIADYEKVMGLIEAGEDLPRMLARKTAGAFRERDFAAWLHGDPAAPSAQPRLSILVRRWNAMGDEIARTAQYASGTDVGAS